MQSSIKQFINSCHALPLEEIQPYVQASIITPDNTSIDDIDDVLSGNHFCFSVKPEAWRALCQLNSNFRHWEYFDTCTLHQCVKHVIEGNYDPEEVD